MQILGELRTSIIERFRSPQGVNREVMATHILPTGLHGSSLYEYPVESYKLKVGYYPYPVGQVARYTAWQKASGASWTPDECKAILSFLGVPSGWTQDGNSFHFSETRASGHIDVIDAFYSPTHAYLFAYLPGVAFDRAALDANMPVGTTTGPDMSNIFPKKES
jgi:hypothetical protein